MRLMSLLRAGLREPLVHFLVGAACIFAYFWLSGADRDPLDYTIEVSSADIERLVETHTRQRRRPPTAQELEGLITEAVENELYYREALRLGLDRDDAVIRRRLGQKLRFVEQQEIDAPDDAELARWRDAQPGRYAGETLYDFRQIYIGRISAQDAQKLVTKLNAGAVAVAAAARPLSLPERFEGADAAQLDRLFGAGFADQLAPLPTERWAGPAASGFGLHLVRIAAKERGAAPDITTIRQQLINDWRADQVEQQRRATFERLSKAYRIKVLGRELTDRPWRD